MAGKSLLKKFVEISPKLPTPHRLYLGRGEISTEFEHELAEDRRHDCQKHSEQCIIKFEEHIVECRAEGQPTENGHLCELEVPQLGVYYRRARKSVSNEWWEEREPSVT